jgi:superfamily II DNA or RNA helicase
MWERRFGNRTPGCSVQARIGGFVYTLKLDVPFAGDIEQTLAAHPGRAFLLTRLKEGAKKGAVSVRVTVEKLLAADNTLRPLDQVFNEAMRATVDQRTVFQPRGYLWRLCLQLEEPAWAAPSLPWTLRFGFQGTNDPSLFDWGMDRAILDRVTYLQILHEAALKFPVLAGWFREGRPTSVSLGFEDVVRFLEADAPGLERAGFGVRLPAWWRGHDAQARVRVAPRVRAAEGAGPTKFSLESVVRVDWEVALGEEVMTPEEIEAVARLKAPLIPLRGRWVHVTADELTAIARLFQTGLAEQRPVRDLVRLAVCGGDHAGVPVSPAADAGGPEDVLAVLDGRRDFAELPPPDGLAATLRPYQVRGYSWLAFMADLGLGACLADQMGLGKSIQVLALLQSRRGRGRPTLLVCPTSVLGHWRREVRERTPRLSCFVHHGDDRPDRQAEFARRTAGRDLVVTSYPLLARDAEILRSVRWDGVILDEGQNVKNPDTQQARAAKALAAEYRVALTGTPVENGLRDLWAILDFLNPGLLGGWTEFQRRFAGADRDARPEAADALRRATRPFLLRRLKADKSVIADLPEKRELKVFCTLTPEQATLYEAALRNRLEEIANKEGVGRRGSVLALLTQLKQICNHPAQFLQDRSPVPDRSGKLARLGEMLQEVWGGGERAIVFTQYTQMGEILREHLSQLLGEPIPFLHGGLPAADRDAMVERFQAAGDRPAVLLISLRAGGTGLNLTRATHVFHFDRWWNPAVEDQATDRAYRIGQTRDVTVHKLVCMGTLEERIDGLIEGKKAVAAGAVDGEEDWLADLSIGRLRELLALGDDAVAG